MDKKNGNLLREVRQMSEANRKEKRWLSIVIAAALVVAGGTFYFLSNPASTQTQISYCGYEAHVHTDDCYKDVDVLACTLEETEGHIHGDECYKGGIILGCGLEETDGHQHTESCYADEQVLICESTDPAHVHTESCYTTEHRLICEVPEAEAHHHDAACYTADRELICGLEEVEPHQHTEACYQTERIICCGYEEHEHSLQCFADTEADLENASVWENTFIGIELSGDWAEDVVSVAKTQLGYIESKANYVVREDGATMDGYSRYGAWYGEPYAEWDALFCDFCLSYAGVDKTFMPQKARPSDWAEFLSDPAIDLYRSNIDYETDAGDLVFFDTDDDQMIDHVGLVADLVKDEVTEQTLKVNVIEGGKSDSVLMNSYDINDLTILGYAELPENPNYVQVELDDTEEMVAAAAADLAATPAEGDILAEVPAEGDILAEVPAEGDILAEVPAEGDILAEAPAEGDILAEVPAEGDVLAEAHAEGDVLAEVPAEGDVLAEAPSEGEELPEDAEAETAVEVAEAAALSAERPTLTMGARYPLASAKGGTMSPTLPTTGANSWQIVSEGYTGKDASKKKSYYDANANGRQDSTEKSFDYDGDGYPDVYVQKNVVPTATENEFQVYLSVSLPVTFDSFLRECNIGIACNNNEQAFGSFTSSLPGGYKGHVLGEVPEGTPGAVYAVIDLYEDTHLESSGSDPYWAPGDANGNNTELISSTIGWRDCPSNVECSNGSIYLEFTMNGKTNYLKLANQTTLKTDDMQGEGNPFHPLISYKQLTNAGVSFPLHQTELDAITDILGENIEFVSVDYSDGSCVAGTTEDGKVQLDWVPQKKDVDPTFIATSFPSGLRGEYSNVAELVYTVRLKTDSIDSCADHMASTVGQSESNPVNTSAVLDYHMMSMEGAATTARYPETGSVQAEFPVPYVRGLRYDISIVKKDASGKALDGAVFALYKEDGVTPVMGASGEPLTLTTSSKTTVPGKISFTDLPWGTYVLVEKEAPFGYGVVTDSPWTVTVSKTEDIKLSKNRLVQDTSGIKDNMLYAGDSCKNNPWVIVDPTAPAESIKFVKVDEKTGSSLKGATFALYGSHREGSGSQATDVINEEPLPAYSNMVSGDNGVFSPSSFKLPDGTYFLKETSTPNGYLEPGEDDTIKIIVGAGSSSKYTYSNVAVKASADAAFSATCSYNSYSKTYTVTVKNRRAGTPVRFVKIDSAYSTPIPGVSFALYGTHGDSAVIDTAPMSGYEDLVSDADGVFSPSGMFLKAGTYYLVEKAAKSGYAPLTGPVKIVVTAEGKMTASIEGNAIGCTLSGDTYTISVPNTRLSESDPVPPTPPVYPELPDPEVTISKKIDYLGDEGIDGQGDLYRLYLNLTSEDQPIDLMIIIDQSGSMKYGLNTTSDAPSGQRRQDYILRLLNGTKSNHSDGFIYQFLTSNPDNDLAVMTFASDSSMRKRVIHPWGDRQTYISLSTPDGATNYTAALDVADDLWKQKADSTKPKIMIFLSDGEPTVGYKNGRIQSSFTSSETLGDGANGTETTSLAQELADFLYYMNADASNSSTATSNRKSFLSATHSGAVDDNGAHLRLNGQVTSRFGKYPYFPEYIDLLDVEIDIPGLESWPYGRFTSRSTFQNFYNQYRNWSESERMAWLFGGKIGGKTVEPHLVQNKRYNLFYLTEESFNDFMVLNPDVVTYTIGYASSVVNGTVYRDGDSDPTNNTRADEVLRYFAGPGRYYPCTSAEELSEAILTIAGLSGITMTDTLSEYVRFAENPKLSIGMTIGSGSTERTIKLYEDSLPTADGLKYLDTTKTTIDTSTGTFHLVFKPEVSFFEAFECEASFNVRVTDKAYEDHHIFGGYDGAVGDPDTDYADNTTSSGQPGFYSNVYDLSYATWKRRTDSQENFQRPVIQVTAVPAIYLKKVGEKETDKAIGGAQFDLYIECAAGATGAVPIPDTTDRYWQKINTDPIVSAAGSAVTIDSLVVYGHYFLIETKAPAGFLQLEAPIEFDVTTSGQISLTDTSDDSPAFLTEDEPLQITVVNKGGYALPKTGGIGSGVFYLMGIILVLISAVCVIRRRVRRV